MLVHCLILIAASSSLALTQEPPAPAKLPYPWRVGEKVRYEVTSSRELSIGGPAPVSTLALDIEVVRAKGAGHVLECRSRELFTELGRSRIYDADDPAFGERLMGLMAMANSRIVVPLQTDEKGAVSGVADRRTLEASVAEVVEWLKKERLRRARSDEERKRIESMKLPNQEKASAIKAIDDLTIITSACGAVLREQKTSQQMIGLPLGDLEGRRFAATKTIEAVKDDRERKVVQLRIGIRLDPQGAQEASEAMDRAFAEALGKERKEAERTVIEYDVSIDSVVDFATGLPLQVSSVTRMKMGTTTTTQRRAYRWLREEKPASRPESRPAR
jgi:hypothetical protein